MASVSLCMIVKNEEEVLERCLKSASAVADEIVVVDTGSSDATKEIAARFTDQVYDFEWKDDFAAARNFAFSKGTKDYVMWLDADDVIPETEQKKLIDLKGRLDAGKPDVVMLRYAIAFDGQGKSTFSYYRERLLKRGPMAVWVGRVHEVIAPFGNVWREEIRIEHRKVRPSEPGRNLRIFEKMVGDGEKLGPREQYYYGKELYYHKRYREAVDMLEHFYGEPDAWIEDRLDARRHISYCYTGLSENGKALKSLLCALELGAPRAELCCDLGSCFLRENRYEDAVFWYRSALRTSRIAGANGFVQEECHGYLPCLQLCVCYDRLGNWKLAERYNELAVKWKPDSAACLHNRTYFASRRAKEEKSES